jgi:hypothetical protein
MVMTTLVILLVSVFLILLSLGGIPIAHKSTAQVSKIQDLPIPKTKYVQLVINWCMKNIGNKKLYPKIIVRYNVVKKKQGHFSFIDNSVVIYVNTHQSVLDLTNTVIHEFVHYIQIPSQKMMKQYNRELQEIGYENHPMETEARMIAHKFDEKCMTEVMGWIMDRQQNTPTQIFQHK